MNVWRNKFKRKEFFLLWPTDFTAAWRKLVIWPRREEWVYKTAIFRVGVTRVGGVFLRLCLRGGCNRGRPFWRKGRSYLHFLQEVDKRPPASCDWESQDKSQKLTYLLNYSMHQSPSWEANRFSASQEILRILRNPKVHYRIHNSLPPVPILIRSIQSIPPDPTSWRSILILSSHIRQGLPSGLFPSGFPTKTMYTPLLYPIRVTCPTHLIHITETN